MMSDEKRREHRKKKTGVFVGVGIIVLVLCILWVMNIKSFFFDSKHSTSVEESLLGSIKNDFENTVGQLSERPSIVSSTVEAITSSTATQDQQQEEKLKAALIASLVAEVNSSTSSTVSTSSTTPIENTTTSTTSTP